MKLARQFAEAGGGVHSRLFKDWYVVIEFNQSEVNSDQSVSSIFE